MEITPRKHRLLGMPAIAQLLDKSCDGQSNGVGTERAITACDCVREPEISQVVSVQSNAFLTAKLTYV
jgi:hypothetical protein